MTARLRIGTRGSDLALWQARTVERALAHVGVESELVIIRTAGDRLQQASLSEVGGKRLFVKEIEDALMSGTVDLAVHSAKDMPAVLPPGLVLAATLSRDDPRDAFVLPAGTPAGEFAAVQALLGGTPAIGTSSVRRAAQLAALFPRATFEPIRGNVDTRLRKLNDSGYDALVLAAAGLRRLGLGDRITTTVPVEACCPAPGQGIIAVEIRAVDDGARIALRAIHNEEAGICLTAERALVAALGGGCQLPLGAVARRRGDALEMHAAVASPGGSRIIRRSGRGPSADPAGLGKGLAAELVRDGAMEILETVRRSDGPVEGSY